MSSSAMKLEHEVSAVLVLQSTAFGGRGVLGGHAPQLARRHQAGQSFSKFSTAEYPARDYLQGKKSVQMACVQPLQQQQQPQPQLQQVRQQQQPQPQLQLQQVWHSPLYVLRCS